MPVCNQSREVPSQEDIASREPDVTFAELDEEAFGPVTRIASRTCDCPTAFVSVVGRGHRIPWGQDAPGHKRTGIEAAFSAIVVRDRRLTTVPNAILDPRFSNNILVRGFPGIRFYAGVPVFDSFARVAAVLCVIDYEPREGLTPTQLEILVELARLSADRLRVVEEIRVPPAPFDEARGEAMLVVDGDASIVHWNSAAERLLAAYADDLFQAGAHRHLPGWDALVAATARAPASVAYREMMPVSLVRADGTKTLAVASVVREGESGEPRFRVLLRGPRLAVAADGS